MENATPAHAIRWKRVVPAACGLIAALMLAAPALAQPFRHTDQVHEPASYATLEEWLGRAADLREHILVSAGLVPMPEKTPLSPKLGEIAEGDGYTAQSVVLETWPGFYLTGTLYHPADGAGPFPAILSAHGHWDEGRFEDTELASVPGRAISLARQGYVVFSYSMIGYNETADVFPHRFREPEYELWGFSAMGLQLWNSIRALDFLTEQPDVDSERIGMTGASGGATQTFLLTAVDPRIKVAAPVNMISAHFQGGCVCENGPLLRTHANNLDIAALAAPRPLLMVSTEGDWTTNTPSVESPAIQDVYRLFGKEDHLANVHLGYPHNYNQDSREAVYAWFARWLLGTDAQTSAEAPFTVMLADTLRAELPTAPVSVDSLFQVFKSRAKHQIEAALPQDWKGLHAYRSRFGRAFRHALGTYTPTSAPELDVRHPPNRSQATDAVLIAYAEADTARAYALAADYRAQSMMAALLPLSPEANASLPPDTIAHWTTYNPTFHAQRITAIHTAAKELLNRPDVEALDVVGLGEVGPSALLARALVPDVRHTRIDFGGNAFSDDAAFTKHLDVPLLRRAGDFTTAAALIAPGALTLENLPAGNLRDRITTVYEAAGATEMLELE